LCKCEECGAICDCNERYCGLCLIDKIVEDKELDVTIKNLMLGGHFIEEVTTSNR